MKKIPYIKKPCNNCPFRKDSTKHWLGEQRITEILDSESFTCHKTTTENILDRKQCAGFMLIKNGNSPFEKLANRLGEDLNLLGRELVFDTERDCIQHHKY